MLVEELRVVELGLLARFDAYAGAHVWMTYSTRVTRPLSSETGVPSCCRRLISAANVSVPLAVEGLRSIPVALPPAGSPANRSTLQDTLLDLHPTQDVTAVPTQDVTAVGCSTTSNDPDKTFQPLPAPSSPRAVPPPSPTASHVPDYPHPSLVSYVGGG